MTQEEKLEALADVFDTDAESLLKTLMPSRLLR